MDVDHPRAGRHRRLHRAGHRIRNVVELQVEEHAIALGGQLPHHCRSGGGEELFPDLESADRAAQFIGELDGFGRRLDIQGHEYRVHA